MKRGVGVWLGGEADLDLGVDGPMEEGGGGGGTVEGAGESDGGGRDREKGVRPLGTGSGSLLIVPYFRAPSMPVHLAVPPSLAPLSRTRRSSPPGRPLS